MEKFDVVVIGGGPGGYPAAIRAAQLGASVALVEKEDLGGTCLNWGCIPTKTLIASGDLLDRAKRSEELGLKPGKMSFDYEAMIARKNKVVAGLKSGVEALLKSNGVAVFKGVATFSDRNRIEIKSRSKKQAIEAANTIIATGSVSAVPGFIPKGKNVVESRAFLDMKSLPKSMIVLGGGVIGCEFACLAAQLGVKVTVVEMLEDILMVMDPDARKVLRTHMEKNLKIKVLTGSPLEKIKSTKTDVSGEFEGRKITAELLLVAVGRRPCTEGLGLENAGLETDESGFIAIDEYCRTARAGVYAIGDVTAGSTQLAHAATSQGITAAENALGSKRKPAETLVPSCIFTAPEVGIAGLTEVQARDAGFTVETGKFLFSGLGKAVAAGETEGFVKWVVDADTDRLIGACSVGAHATELISEAAAVIRGEFTARELGNTIHCHPTFSEAWMEAAHAVHGECIHQPARKRK